jgi:hypothetical protein
VTQLPGNASFLEEAGLSRDWREAASGRGCVRDACNFSRLRGCPAKFTLLDSKPLFLRSFKNRCCTPKPGNYKFSLPMAECGMTIALPRSIYDLSAPLPSQEYAAATFDHGLAEERSPAMPDADVQN